MYFTELEQYFTKDLMNPQNRDAISFKIIVSSRKFFKRNTYLIRSHAKCRV